MIKNEGESVKANADDSQFFMVDKQTKAKKKIFRVWEIIYKFI